MGLFDKLFPKKENKIDRAMEDAYQNFVENNPIIKKAKRVINESADRMTAEMEEAAYGSAKSKPGEHGDIMEHFEERSRDWDKMFDQIVDKELGQYKICEACGQAVPSDLDICPNCKAKLSDHTVAVWICRHCGAKNRTLDMYCKNCGKKFELVPEENKEK